MMSDSDSDSVELSAGLSLDAVESDNSERPGDDDRLEIIRLMGQLGAGDQILWNDRKQPLTVVRRVTSDDLRGQALNFRKVTRSGAARARGDQLEDHVGDLHLTGEFGKEFLLIRGPRGGLYRLTTAYSNKRGRFLPVFQRRVRSRTHKSGRFRDSDAWDGWGNEVLRLARVDHDGDVDPDAVDPDDSANFVGLDDLAGRSVLGWKGQDNEELFSVHTFTPSDVDSGVVPSSVMEYVTEHFHTDDVETGTYSASGDISLDLSEYAGMDPEDLPSRHKADTFLSITREDGGLKVSEVPNRERKNDISDDGAYIAELYAGENYKVESAVFGSSYPVFVERGGKDAVKDAPSADYEPDYKRWRVDAQDLQVALDSLLDVEGVDRITAPPRTLKFLMD